VEILRLVLYPKNILKNSSWHLGKTVEKIRVIYPGACYCNTPAKLLDVVSQPVETLPEAFKIEFNKLPKYKQNGQ
jgi:hypothetical protein